MNDETDTQLLRAYAEQRSEPAFAELVRRHVDFVYSAARRMVVDPHLAEDVTQGAFIALAKAARQLTNHPVLSGWLHRTTQNIAAQTVRTNMRRHAREQEAVAMNELLAHDSDAAWENIAPHLDIALGELSEADRDALLLRYFERKSAREMAQTLNVSEDAAQKRVSRAVERLREFFSKRNVTVGVSGLAVLISANAVQAAPVRLIVTISSAIALAGTTIQTSTAIAATKTIAMTTLQKTLVTSTLAIAVGTGIYEAGHASNLEKEMQALRLEQSPLTDQIQKLQRESENSVQQLAVSRVENERLKGNAPELLKLRVEVARLRNELAQMKATANSGENDPMQLEMKSWIARVEKLGKRLEQMPEERIPEFQYLETVDWLDATKDLDLEDDDDIRIAARSLRQNAQSNFATHTRDALRKFIKTNNGASPTDLSQLKSYYHPEAEDEIFKRYELLSNPTNVGKEDYIVREIAPAKDSIYENMSLLIGPTGWRRIERK